MRHGTLPLTHRRWQLASAGLVLAAALIYSLVTIKAANSNTDIKPATQPIKVEYIELAAPVDHLQMHTRGKLLSKNTADGTAQIGFSLPLHQLQLLKAIDQVDIQGTDPVISSRNIQQVPHATNPLIEFHVTFAIDKLPSDWIVGTPMQLDLTATLKTALMPIDYRYLRATNRVWLVNAEQKLMMQPVHIAYQDGKRLYIDQGLKNGDRLITSSLAFASDGLALKPVQQSNVR